MNSAAMAHPELSRQSASNRRINLGGVALYQTEQCLHVLWSSLLASNPAAAHGKFLMTPCPLSGAMTARSLSGVMPGAMHLAVKTKKARFLVGAGPLVFRA